MRLFTFLGWIVTIASLCILPAPAWAGSVTLPLNVPTQVLSAGAGATVLQNHSGTMVQCWQTASAGDPSASPFDFIIPAINIFTVDGVKHVWCVSRTGTTIGVNVLAGVSGSSSLPANAATASNQTTQITRLDTLHTDLIAATPAGELHVGEIGGNQTLISVAQTVTASSAYASGNAVGGLVTISGAARVSGSLGAGGTSGLLQSVIVASKSAQTAQIDVVIFKANPSASTCTDKTAVSIAAADFDKVLGVAKVSDWYALGAPSLGQALNMALPYALASSTTLYACAITRGTPTFSATSDITLIFNTIRN